MIMIAVNALFFIAATRGFTWSTLVILIPLATLAGLLDTPPDFERMNVFASDVMKVFTKAAVTTSVSFAVGRGLRRVYRFIDSR